MNFIKYFTRRRNTANVAKERLQIIISHERAQRSAGNDYLEKLQSEILDVIAKYIKIDRDQVKVQLDRIGENAVLELNVTLPDKTLAEEATA